MWTLQRVSMLGERNIFTGMKDHNSIDNQAFPDTVKHLRAGMSFLFSGVLYTARDQAHRRLVERIKKNVSLPVDLSKQFIYYCGPSLTPPGLVFGSCGPTTSSRMDSFVEPLLAQGVLGMIGKGRRSKAVRKLIKRYAAVYLLAPAGCGALLATKVVTARCVAFKELGPEAIYRLTVKDFPLIVGIDSHGRAIYDDL